MRLIKRIKSYLRLTDIKDLETKVDKEVKTTKVLIATLNGESERFLANKHRQGDKQKVLNNCTCVCDAGEVRKEK